MHDVRLLILGRVGDVLLREKSVGDVGIFILKEMSTNV